MKKRNSIFFFLFFALMVKGQTDTLFLNLEEVLSIALEKSLDLQSAQSSYRENQQNILQLKELLRPRFSLRASLPNLSRAIELRPLPDGRDAFVNRSTMSNRLEFNVDYTLISTGGIISASSSISRLDIFETNLFDYQRTYFVTPIALSFTQPIFQFNSRKWQQERLDLLNTELVSRQAVVREEVLTFAIQLYNQVYQAQKDIELHQFKVKEVNDLYQLKQQLAEIGKVEKAEMLRLELEIKSNQIRDNEVTNLWENHRVRLCDFLQIKRNQLIYLIDPPDFSKVNIDPDLALERAVQNPNVRALNKLKIREAEAVIERTNKSYGLNLSVNFSLGLNSTDEKLSELYRELVDRQTLSVALHVPLNSGKLKSINQQIANEQLLREKLDIEQQQIEISRNVLLGIKEFNAFAENISLERESLNTANEIYQLIRKQYTLGEKNITELNLARNNYEAAVRNLNKTTSEILVKYYQLRRICLYDFIEGKRLSQ